MGPLRLTIQPHMSAHRVRSGDAGLLGFSHQIMPLNYGAIGCNGGMITVKEVCMATQTELHSRPSGAPLRTAGRVILILGLVGGAVWATMATVASGIGTVDENSITFDVVEVGASDPVNQPGIWDARASTGRIVWEGPKEEWQSIIEDDRAAYQADLRTTWLHPSAAIATVGLVIYILGRRRSSEDVSSA
jgi:hypothetical protein